MTSTPFHAYYTARILDSLQDDDKFIPSFASSDIKVYPYQVGAALFATRSPYSKGVVLMDESGLGKSTEAMLVVTQKWYEGKTRSIIFVPNADLLVQWERLIESKYSIPFVTIANATQLSDVGNTFEQDAVVLTTFDFAVQCAEQIQKIIWDIAVFEEASLLAAVYKDDNKQARELKRITEGSFKLLLTGTPIEKNMILLETVDTRFDKIKRIAIIFVKLNEFLDRFFVQHIIYPFSVCFFNFAILMYPYESKCFFADGRKLNFKCRSRYRQHSSFTKHLVDYDISLNDFREFCIFFF